MHQFVDFYSVFTAKEERDLLLGLARDLIDS